MLLVYADGGIRKGKGSWAYIIVRAPVTSIGVDYAGQLSGKVVGYGAGLAETALHSSHMELVAAFEGISHALRLPKASITLVSDSHYVTSGLAKAHARAQAAINSDKDTASMVRIWRSLTTMYAFNDISAVHVKGHRKQTGNSFADYMCGEVLSGRHSELPHKVYLFNTSRIWRSSLIKTRR